MPARQCQKRNQQWHQTSVHRREYPTNLITGPRRLSVNHNRIPIEIR